MEFPPPPDIRRAGREGLRARRVSGVADVRARATDVVELFEGGQIAELRDRLNDRVRGWVDRGRFSIEAYVHDVWRPGLDDLAGRTRRITDAVQVSDTTARITFEGDRGPAFATIRFDPDGRLAGWALCGQVFEGIATVVIACPRERREEIADFYAALLGTDRRRVPGFAFGEARGGYVAPRWPDPEHPQQMHLDVGVDDLAAAEAVVLDRGATLLQDKDDYRSYADPVGHPFCLYSDTAGNVGAGGPPGVLARIVIDCFSPRALAGFYEALLGMTKRVEDSPQRVVIGHEDGRLPMLAFQHASPHVAPRWPDPRFPQQMHFDLKFNDGPAMQALAERLGAMRLPPQGGSCPVYADPAGHPFCLCMFGE